MDTIYMTLNIHHRTIYPFLTHLLNCQKKVKAESPDLPRKTAQGSSRALLRNSGVTCKKLKEAPRLILTTCKRKLSPV